MIEIPLPAAVMIWILTGILSCVCGANCQASAVCRDRCKAQGYAHGTSPFRRIGDTSDACNCVDEQRPVEKDGAL